MQRSSVSGQVRSSFSGHIAGAPVFHGNQEAAQHLWRAFQAAEQVNLWEGDDARWHMHLFHSYTARTHPALVRFLFRSLSSEQIVLDPFVGSGTTLVEAALRGARGMGMDVNGVAVRLARWKATPLSSAQQQELMKASEHVVEGSRVRVQKKIRPRKQWDDRRYYEPHVYLELCGLREEIEQLREGAPAVREGLLLMFSSLVVKASRQRSDSQQEQVTRVLRRGQITEWFWQRAQEVVHWQRVYRAHVPVSTPAPRVLQNDARGAWAASLGERVDVVFTSPPYVGVYDYASHQERRSAWLQEPLALAWAQEMASRRACQHETAETPWARHCEDTQQWMRQVTHALRPHGIAYVLVGDGVFARRIVAGDTPVVDAAQQQGLSYVGGCSVPRAPVRGGGATKYQEHLLLFRAGA